VGLEFRQELAGGWVISVGCKEVIQLLVGGEGVTHVVDQVEATRLLRLIFVSTVGADLLGQIASKVGQLVVSTRLDHVFR
jgi:hypothetical protein